jgi:hypothetical protein
MIRWLWDKMLKWGWDYNRDLRNDDRPLSKSELKRLSNTISLSDGLDEGIEMTDPITFKVEAVQGGTLVETRWYDHKRDESIRKLHIVMSDENLAEAIGKIVTMELIRK